jgi:hypothetical protein
MSLPLAFLLASPSPSPSSVSPSDLGVTASSYASFAEIMTGFSFAALAIYLAYESSTGRHSTEESEDENSGGNDDSPIRWENVKGKLPVQVGIEYPIRRTKVAATLFYAMASLAISSFLYASLTVQVEDVTKVAATLLIYGVVFGASVLAFFYALTLMTYENKASRMAAKAAYWVVVIVGPTIVLRFIADAAQGAWNSRCSRACVPESWSPPLVGGVVILLFLLAISILISKTRIFERWAALHDVCNWFCIRPVLPAFVIFAFSVVIAIADIWVVEPVNYVPSEIFIWTSLIGAFLLLAFFALACGCVVGPRLSEPSSKPNTPSDGQNKSAT